MKSLFSCVLLKQLKAILILIPFLLEVDACWLGGACSVGTAVHGGDLGAGPGDDRGRRLGGSERRSCGPGEVGDRDVCVQALGTPGSGGQRRGEP